MITWVHKYWGFGGSSPLGPIKLAPMGTEEDSDDSGY